MIGRSGRITARKETFLIAEQLQAARAAHWRQKQSPILTLEDAQSWLEQHPLCLYLPRQAQLPAPAPSFVEACMGSRQATPGAAAIEQAQGLLTRLVASGTVVPLNLLGAVGEQPDFLAQREALPFVLCPARRSRLEACAAEILRPQSLSPGARVVEGPGQGWRAYRR